MKPTVITDPEEIDTFLRHHGFFAKAEELERRAVAGGFHLAACETHTDTAIGFCIVCPREPAGRRRTILLFDRKSHEIERTRLGLVSAARSMGFEIERQEISDPGNN